jgi:leader peptidase (prepilin peptidase)/N-methyltransferase
MAILIVVCALAGLAAGFGLSCWLHLLDREQTIDLRPRRPKRGHLLLVPLTGAVWAAAAAADEGLVYGLLCALFGTALAIAFVTDVDSRRIPNRLVLPASGLAVALAWAWPDRTVVELLVGGAVAFAFMAAMFAVSRGGLGAGDVKFALLIGLVTGYPSVVGALMIGVFSAAVFAVILVLSRKGGMRTGFAYGPFLAVGGALAMLWPSAFGSPLG